MLSPEILQKGGPANAFAWGVVFASQEHHGLSALRPRSVLFLVLSGVATGVSVARVLQGIADGARLARGPHRQGEPRPTHTAPSVCSPNRISTSHRTPRKEYRRKCQHQAQTMTHN